MNVFGGGFFSYFYRITTIVVPNDSKKNWMLIIKIRDFGFLAVSSGGANPGGRRKAILISECQGKKSTIFAQLLGKIITF